jgi:hypothetical protein
MKRLLLVIASCASAFAVFASAGTGAGTYKDCSSKIGSCEYYRCRESVQPCGKDGYFQRFGYPYCSLISKKLGAQVTPAEKAWIERAAVCLQTELNAMPVDWACSRTEDEAIISHTNCYIDAGFCKTSMDMRLKLFTMIYKELKDPRMISVFFKIVKACEKYNYQNRDVIFPFPEGELNP